MDNQTSKIQQDQFANPSQTSDCRTEKYLDRLPLAMAYVPWQFWNQTYRPETALENGTIFPELDLPWLGTSSTRRTR